MSGEELKQWKKDFIDFMCTRYGIDVPYAIIECDAYIESVGVDDLGTSDNAVYECVDGWEV